MMLLNSMLDFYGINPILSSRFHHIGLSWADDPIRKEWVVSKVRKAVHPAKRSRLAFVPNFDHLAGWAYLHAARNLWRVQPTHDIEDLMAEARYCFVKVHKKYPSVREEKHFAALFRVTFVNRIHRLALAETKDRPFNRIRSSDLSENAEIMDCFSDRCRGYEMAEQIIRTEGAPEPILRLIRRLEEKQYLIPDGYIEAEGEQRLRLVNEWLCVIAKQPVGTDMIAMVKNWLNGEPHGTRATL